MTQPNWLSPICPPRNRKGALPSTASTDDAAAARDRQRDQFSMIAGTRGQCLTSSHRAALKLAEPPSWANCLRSRRVANAVSNGGALAAHRQKIDCGGRFSLPSWRKGAGCLRRFAPGSHIDKRARRCRQNEPRRRCENPSRGDITLASSVCSCGQHAWHTDRDEALFPQHQQLTRVLEPPRPAHGAPRSGKA